MKPAFLFSVHETILGGNKCVTSLRYEGPNGTEFLLSPIQNDCYLTVNKSLGRHVEEGRICPFITVEDLVTFCKKEAPKSSYIFVCDLSHPVVYTDPELETFVNSKWTLLGGYVRSLYAFQTKNFAEPGSLTFTRKPNYSVELAGDVYCVHYFTLHILPALMHHGPSSSPSMEPLSYDQLNIVCSPGKEGHALLFQLTNLTDVTKLCEWFKYCEHYLRGSSIGYKIKFAERSECGRCPFSFESGLCFHNCHFDGCSKNYANTGKRFVCDTWILDNCGGTWPFSCDCGGVENVGNKLSCQKKELQKCYYDIIQCLGNEIGFMSSKHDIEELERSEYESVGAIVVSKENENRFVVKHTGNEDFLGPIIGEFMRFRLNDLPANSFFEEGDSWVTKNPFVANEFVLFARQEHIVYFDM